MAIGAALVKELRERTGAGMMDCKRALVEAEGDLQQASELLRKSGQAKADKKAARVAAEGTVLVKGTTDGHKYVVVEVNSETDFVAKDENFAGFAATVAEAALAGQYADVAALMASESDGKTLETRRQELVAKVGENIAVRRFQVLQSSETIGSYSHMGRIGVLIELQGGDSGLFMQRIDVYAVDAFQFGQDTIGASKRSNANVSDSNTGTRCAYHGTEYLRRVLELVHIGVISAHEEVCSTLNLGDTGNIGSDIVGPRFAGRYNLDRHTRGLDSVFNIEALLYEALAFNEARLLIGLTGQRLMAHDASEVDVGEFCCELCELNPAPNVSDACAVHRRVDFDNDADTNPLLSSNFRQQ